MIRLAVFVFLEFRAMENEMFDKLMAELQQTRREMDEKITSSMAEVKREVSYAQERTAKDFSQKLNRTTYQFRKKGNEKQYTFNSGVEEAIASAQQELERMASSVDDGGKESLRKAADHLEEGASALKTRQKHIKVADRSDYGWGAVRHYQSDPLADNSDDESSSEGQTRRPRRTSRSQRPSTRKPPEEEAGAAEGDAATTPTSIMTLGLMARDLV